MSDEYPVGHPARYQNPPVGFQQGAEAAGVPGFDHRHPAPVGAPSDPADDAADLADQLALARARNQQLNDMLREAESKAACSVSERDMAVKQMQAKEAEIVFVFYPVLKAAKGLYESRITSDRAPECAWDALGDALETARKGGK